MGFFSNLFSSSQEGKEKYIYISGMMCDHCAAHVKEALEAVPGVLKAKVSLMDKRATVHVTDEADDKAMFKAVVNAVAPREHCRRHLPAENHASADHTGAVRSRRQLFRRQ